MHTYSSRAHAPSLSRVQLFLTPWTAALQAPLSSDYPGKNTGVGYHFPHQGISQTQGSNLRLLHLLHWQVDSLPLCHLGSLQTHTHTHILSHHGLAPNTEYSSLCYTVGPCHPSFSSEYLLQLVMIYSFVYLFIIFFRLVFKTHKGQKLCSFPLASSMGPDKQQTHHIY